jgi:hypothetical protein
MAGRDGFSRSWAFFLTKTTEIWKYGIPTFRKNLNRGDIADGAGVDFFGFWQLHQTDFQAQHSFEKVF